MFWEIFYNLCIKNGTKPNAVCKELNLSNATSTHWKNGTMPKGDVLIKIADYFGCSVDYLLGREFTQNSSMKEQQPFNNVNNNNSYYGAANIAIGNDIKQDNLNISGIQSPISTDADKIIHELAEMMRSLDNEEQRKALAAQVRSNIQALKTVLETSKKKQN